MASVDFSTLTLAPESLSDIRQCLFTNLPTLPEIAKIYNFQSGVVAEEKIPIKTNLDMVGIIDPLTSRPESGAGIKLSEITVSPKNIGDTIYFIASEMNRLLKPYSGSISKYTNYFFDNGSANNIVANITMEMADGMLRSLHRIAWWGDTAVAASTSSLPGLVSADDVKFFNILDGFWKQIFANCLLTDPLKATPKYTVTKNAATTRAGQAITPAESFEILRGVFDLGSSSLISDSNKVLLVTKNVFTGYKRYLESVGVNRQVDITMYGLPSLDFEGIPLIDMSSIWGYQNAAKFEQKNTHAADWLPTRVLMTNPNDLILASLALSDNQQIESNYEKLLRKYWLAFGYTLDAKIGRPTEMVAAY